MSSDATDVVLMEGPAPVEPPDTADSDGPESPLSGLVAATLARESAVTAGVLLTGGDTARLVNKASAAGLPGALPDADVSESSAASAAGVGEHPVPPLDKAAPGVTALSAVPAAVAGLCLGEACRVDACLRVAFVCASTV